MAMLENIVPVHNEVLLTKLRRVFEVFDNGDGFFHRDDLQMSIDKFVSQTSSHLDEKKKEEVSAVMGDCTNRFLGDARSPRITWEEFNAIYENHALNLEVYRRNITEMYNATFECMDVDRDGNISFEEFKNYRSVERCYKDSELRRVFDIMDRNKDGHIDRDEFISAYLTYFIDRTVGQDYLPLFD